MVLLGAGAAASPVGATILEWFGFHGVAVSEGQPPVTDEPTPPAEPPDVSLDEAAALAVPGASPMMFTGKPMSGMIDLSDDATADDTRRARVMALALGFVRALPPK